MDHQAPLNGTDTQSPAPKQVSRGAAHFARNLLDIVEMQWRLFAIEFGELRSIVVWGMAGFALAVGLVWAALPTALVGFGFWLATALEKSTAVGMLLAALIAVLVASVLMAFAWWQLNKRSHFLRSRAELKENMATLRRLLADRERTTER